MQKTTPIRLLAKVQWHANGAFTRVSILEDRDSMEIPTESIPSDLRAIGSEFCLIMKPIRSSDFDSAEELSELLAESIVVERLAPSRSS
jgi:hypothetical protein